MFERAMGHFYKQWIMWRKSPADLAWVFVYPFIGLMSIGFFVSFLMGSGASMETFMFAFAGIIIWNSYDISQRAITYGITFEIWSDSLRHFFSATSTENDYILGNSLFGLATAAIALVLVGTMGFLAFGFYVFAAGFYLILAFLSVFVFATAIGLTIDYFIITKNVKYMSLIWMSTGIIMIFSGVYYPVTILPEPARIVSYILPSTHAIESIRYALVSNASSASMSILVSLALSGAYFILGYFAFFRAVKKGKELGRIAKH
jgi:ABC-2 type transport system permease protein